MEEIVFFNGIPSQVICFGGMLPQHLGQNPVKPKPSKLIFLVPGYPGNTTFYTRFAERLHSSLQIPIWIPAYVGCTFGLHLPNFNANKHLFNAQSQVELMKNIILRYLDGIEIIVVAHSLGSWISLEVMKDAKCNQLIRKSFFIAPAFERFGCSEFGKKLLLKCQRGLRFPFLTVWTAFLSDWINCKLYNPSKLHTIRNVLDGNNILPIFALFVECMAILYNNRESVTLVAKHVDKLKLYYIFEDQWVPISFVEDLKRDVPNVDAEIDNLGMVHDFEFDYYETASNLVSNWIRDLM